MNVTSPDGDRQAPWRQAALAALQAGAPAAAAMVRFESSGRCIIYGEGASALEAGARLAERLPVTVLLRQSDAETIMPLRSRASLRCGRIVRAEGHLGAFELTVDGYREPQEEGGIAPVFGGSDDGVTARCDILIDLSGGSPLLTGGARRSGYLRPDPGDPLAVERALFDALGLVGSFEQPRHLSVRPHLCAHARNGATGCTRCLDVCPLGAITPEGEAVVVDPHVCAGCGGCHAACPTGAIRYSDPPADRQLAAMTQALAAWRRADGPPPLVLVHGADHGADMLAMLAREQGGLPETVLPLALNHATQTGPELMFHALAAGAARVAVLLDPGDEGEDTQEHVGVVASVMAALGHGEARALLWQESDPVTLGERIAGLDPASPMPAADVTATGDMHEKLWAALEHIHRHAPAATDTVALRPGAPFGAVLVAPGCTLCLSCVGVCPTGALADHAEAPQLRFREDACVQCGLCRATCPEDVITLEPRLAFADAAHEHAVLVEEEPFACIVCGKPFGVRRSIERVIAGLADHPMMQDPLMAERLQMCGDCRVADLAGAGQKNVDRPRTTDDWLARAGVDGRRNRG